MGSGKQKNGRFKCQRKLTLEDFVYRASEIHGEKYDYSKVEYIEYTFKVKIKCRRHGIFHQTPADHLDGHGCKKCHFESFKKWSLDEDEIIKKFYREKGSHYCSIRLNNKSLNSIRSRASLLGVSKKQKFNHKYLPSSIWSSICSRAKCKGLELDITPEYIWDLYISQNKKCALTGRDIEFSKDNSKITASVDRIDSSLGYIKGNIQITDKKVNRTKLNLREIEFYTMCRDVYLNKSNSFQEEFDLIEDYWYDTEFPVKNGKFKDIDTDKFLPEKLF